MSNNDQPIFFKNEEFLNSIKNNNKIAEWSPSSEKSYWTDLYERYYKVVEYSNLIPITEEFKKHTKEYSDSHLYYYEYGFMYRVLISNLNKIVSDKSISMVKLPFLKDALEIFTKAIDANQDYEEALYQRGIIYYEISKYPQLFRNDNENITNAIEDFKKAIELNENVSLYYYRRGRALESLLRLMNHISETNTQDSEDDKKAMSKNALEMFKKASKLNPTCAEYKVNNLDF